MITKTLFSKFAHAPGPAHTNTHLSLTFTFALIQGSSMSTKQSICWRENILTRVCFSHPPWPFQILWYTLFISFFTCSEFLQLNPVGFVPVLVDGQSVISDSFAITMVSSVQSLLSLFQMLIAFPFSIQMFYLFIFVTSMQYLEDKYPHHPLLPHDLHKRAINFQV